MARARARKKVVEAEPVEPPAEVCLSRWRAGAAVGSLAAGFVGEGGEAGTLKPGDPGPVGQVRHGEDRPGGVGGQADVGEVETTPDMEAGRQGCDRGVVEVEMTADMQAGWQCRDGCVVEAEITADMEVGRQGGDGGAGEVEVFDHAAPERDSGGIFRHDGRDLGGEFAHPRPLARFAGGEHFLYEFPLPRYQFFKAFAFGVLPAHPIDPVLQFALEADQLGAGVVTIFIEQFGVDRPVQVFSRLCDNGFEEC